MNHTDVGKNHDLVKGSQLKGESCHVYLGIRNKGNKKGKVNQSNSGERSFS